MKESALERALNGANKFFDGLGRFYDETSSRWYIEAAKHLVPTYTMHKMSNTGSDVITFLGGAIDAAKILGYAYLITVISR